LQVQLGDVVQILIGDVEDALAVGEDAKLPDFAADCEFAVETLRGRAALGEDAVELVDSWVFGAGQIDGPCSIGRELVSVECIDAASGELDGVGVWLRCGRWLLFYTSANAREARMSLLIAYARADFRPVGLSVLSGCAPGV
jgi:hypothetical protein